MEAGRELDALVAERVMGWTRTTDTQGKAKCPDGGNDWWLTPNGEPRCVLCEEQPHPAFSTDIAAAWELFGKMYGHVERRGHPIPGEEWIAQMWYGGQAGQSFAATAPLALCLAALKAVGVEV